MLTASRKYQFMETQMQRKAASLTDKIPDIEKTLDTVRFLKTRTVRCSLGMIRVATRIPSGVGTCA